MARSAHMTLTKLRLLIHLTDYEGDVLVDSDQTHEPLPGSVVMEYGLHGTAWQRHFNDGKWHSTRGGRALTWEQMLCKRHLWLIYDAEPRDE